MGIRAGDVVAAMTWGRLTYVEAAVSTLPEDWEWVEDLIAEEGRAMTITLPGALADASKPWRGNAAGMPTDAIGVFWAYTAKEINGDHIKRGDQRVLLIPDAVVDIEEGTKVADSLDSSSWNVIDVQQIISKSDIILYILHVRQ